MHTFFGEEVKKAQNSLLESSRHGAGRPPDCCRGSAEKNQGIGAGRMLTAVINNKLT
jgi:hypothetical protein